MIGSKSLVAVAMTAAVAALGASAATASSEREQERPYFWVVPCSLVGINPARHPDIFGNPAVAKSYGFVRSRDGTWQVQSGCRRH
jgi:hypothetical protein